MHVDGKQLNYMQLVWHKHHSQLISPHQSTLKYCGMWQTLVTLSLQHTQVSLIPTRATKIWLNFMSCNCTSWYDDMSWHEVHFWSFNLSLHEKSHKWLITLVCWYLVSYEYMWPCTSRNIGQISYILCQLLVCSGKSQLSIYANTNCLKYRYGLGLCHIMSRLLYVMT